MASSLTRQRLALFVLFFIPGLTIASWVTRTPAIRDLLGSSTGEMGLILFGLSVGAMTGILLSGPLVARLGARPVIFVGMLLVILSMPTIGLGSATSTSFLAAGGLFLFGLGMGAAEVAMNVAGADLEQHMQRSILPPMHGCFSLGTVVGAATGIIFTAVSFPVVWHLIIIGVVAVSIFTLAIPHVPNGVGRRSDTERSPDRHVQRPRVWKDKGLLLIAAIVLAMSLAEGSASDWLPLLMVDDHGFDPAWGSAIYATFAAAMTVGRFCGGFFIERFGRAAVLTVSAMAGALGLALVAFSTNQILAGIAVILWGLGASLGFPVAISAAGDHPDNPAARVSFAATIGYIAFLVGPPLLGFVGDASDLRTAMIIPLAAMIAAITIAPRISRARHQELAPSINA
jgi:predicted MFS family arabinose efflux permease